MASTFLPQFEMKSRQADCLQIFFSFKGNGDDAGKVFGPDAMFVKSVEKTADGRYMARLKVPVTHRVHPVGALTEGAAIMDAGVVSAGKDFVELATSDKKGKATDAEIVHVSLALFNSRLKR